MILNERVLCVERESIPEKFLQKRGAMKTDWEEFLTILKKGSPAFLSRVTVEKDSSYKQLIPYVLLRNIKSEYLCYKRAGSEKRLTDKFSIGIGGHIDITDGKNAKKLSKKLSLEKVIMEGIRRELHEEAGIENCLQHTDISTAFIGIINEEESEVGEVHLGLVFEYHLSPHTPLCLGEELNSPCWLPEETCLGKMDLFELWSRLALELANSEKMK